MAPKFIIFLLVASSVGARRQNYHHDTGQTHQDIDNIFGQQSSFPNFHEIEKKPESGQMYENFDFGQKHEDPFNPQTHEDVRQSLKPVRGDQQNVLQDFEKIHFGKKKTEPSYEPDLGQQYEDDSFLLQDDGQQQSVVFPEFP